MKNLKPIYLALLLITMHLSAFAQGPGFDDDVHDSVPLDGGLSLLAVAGVGYGIKKLKDAKAKKNLK